MALLLTTTACCTPLGGPPLDATEAEATARLFKALADPTRLQILSLIAPVADGVCVCDLVATLDRSQPTVSHHLKILANAGLVAREQRGKWAWFTIDKDQLGALQSVLTLQASPT